MILCIKKILCVLLFLSMMSGCGFHLAGSGEFPSSLDNTSVQGAASNREMVRLVEKNLSSNQINVVGIDQATALLNILSEETDRVVLTLDNEGKAREFALSLKITFDVKRPDNSYLLREQSINVNRVFVFDKGDLLGSNQEEQQLFSEMRKNAAKIIINRLQTITD